MSWSLSFRQVFFSRIFVNEFDEPDDLQLSLLLWSSKFCGFTGSWVIIALLSVCDFTFSIRIYQECFIFFRSPYTNNFNHVFFLILFNSFLWEAHHPLVKDLIEDFTTIFILSLYLASLYKRKKVIKCAHFAFNTNIIFFKKNNL